MTREDIVRMAREAGWPGIYAKPLFSITMQEDDFLRFAALVAAAEREACAKVCDSLHDKIELVEKTEQYPGEYGSEYDAGQGNAISECVDAIRARAEK